MGVHYNPKIVTEGLTLYIDPANIKSYTGSGNVVVDMSRSVNVTSVTLQNGWSYSANNNGTFILDGVNGRIYVNGNAVSQTVIAWAMTTNTSISVQDMYSPEDNGSDNWLGLHNGQPYVTYCQSSDVNHTYMGPASAAASNGVWFQIATTISGNTVSLYYNGAVVNSAVAAFTIAPWQTRPRIGCRSTDTQQLLQGAIGPVFAYSTTHTAQQIKQNFDALRGRFGI
jgi:hypothetical protein